MNRFFYIKNNDLVSKLFPVFISKPIFFLIQLKRSKAERINTLVYLSRLGTAYDLIMICLFLHDLLLMLLTAWSVLCFL